MASVERGSAEFSLDSFLSRFLGRNDRLLRDVYPYFCTLFITLCTATNFGYVFFFLLFSSLQLENSSANNFCTIFSSAFHHQICTLGSSNGSTNSVGSFSSSNTRHAREKKLLYVDFVLRIGGKALFPPDVFFKIIAHTRCDTASRW